MVSARVSSTPHGQRLTDSGLVKVEDWEKRTEVPMLLLALTFLFAYSWPILDRRLNPGLETSMQVLSYAIWGAFTIDLLIRVRLAEQPGSYLARHWYDVAFIMLPFLRSLRLLRMIITLRMFGRAAAVSLASQVLVYVLGTAVLAILVGAETVLAFERDATGSNIATFEESLWWAVVTVATVGYGDFYPVTSGGRLVDAILMFLGIGLVGSTTGAVASWLVSSATKPLDHAD